MAASTISIADICNMALGHAGSRAYITKIDDGSEEADVCNVFYDLCRRRLLTYADWPFARQRVVLAVTALVRLGWASVYKYPVDVLVIRSLWPSATIITSAAPAVPYQRAQRADQRIVYSTENDPPAPLGSGNGRIILTDMPAAECHYTADMDDTTLFPVAFVDALAVLLGAKLAWNLVSDAKKAQDLMEMFKKHTLPDALADAFNAEVQDPAPSSQYEAIRSGGVTSTLTGFGVD